MSILHTVHGNPERIIAGARSRITKAGGDVWGDEKSGSFSIRGFEGSYFAIDGGVEISVSEKPFFVSDSAVKEWLKNNIKS